MSKKICKSKIDIDFLRHDLAHDFPEYLEKMRSLKATDPHFAKLFDTYDANDQAIKKFEMGGGFISDEALEVLKKKRLKIKDEIYQLLLIA